ncbi:hypothetical protein BV22DRAFT_1106151 [Leucogyrophana mollusca]|uniref:Uncharacterized protein n=1 Tax=Leucogyrophana mollusca TaxID=85980 RepID=A0ACB8BC23_9AGAM|nr:hypothetical protein BV22DRAFT_1106151 [Leucogyrophana mollusca]
MADLLPPYTPSAPSPAYSAVPSIAVRPIGAFRRITDAATVVLYEQPYGILQPVYRQNALVHGHITVKSKDFLTEVSIKLEGEMRVKVSGNSTRVSLFSTLHSLWDSKDICGDRCSAQAMPFAITLPSSYRYKEYVYPLPPSYDDHDGTASVSYTLTAILSKPKQLVSLSGNRVRISIPLHYHPRFRPNLPMLPSELSFIPMLKSYPEEWYQISTIMRTRKDYTPIEVDLFIPSVRVYTFTDTIAFHLQLRVPSSLKASRGVPLAEGGVAFATACGTFHVRVYLLRLRQTARRPSDTKTKRRTVLGEGSLEPVDVTPPAHSQRSAGLDVLSWEGQIECTRDVSTTGFTSTHLSVKDYIVVTVTPKYPTDSPYLRLQHCQPIRLVTDPWSDRG